MERTSRNFQHCVENSETLSDDEAEYAFADGHNDTSASQSRQMAKLGRCQTRIWNLEVGGRGEGGSLA